MRSLLLIFVIAITACQTPKDGKTEQQEAVSAPVKHDLEKSANLAEEIPFFDRFNQSLGDTISVESVNLDINLPHALNDSLKQKYIAYYDSAKGYRHEVLGTWFPIAKKDQKNYYSLYFGLLGDSEALLQINYSKIDSSEIDRLFVAEGYFGCSEYEEFYTVLENEQYKQLFVSYFMDEKPDSSVVFYQLSAKGRFKRIEK